MSNHHSYTGPRACSKVKRKLKTCPGSLILKQLRYNVLQRFLLLTCRAFQPYDPVTSAKYRSTEAKLSTNKSQEAQRHWSFIRSGHGPWISWHATPRFATKCATHRLKANPGITLRAELHGGPTLLLKILAICSNHSLHRLIRNEQPPWDTEAHRIVSAPAGRSGDLFARPLRAHW